MQFSYKTHLLSVQCLCDAWTEHMQHIAEECLLTRFVGGLPALHLTDDNAVELTGSSLRTNDKKRK